MKKQLIFIGCFVCNVCSLPQTERKFLKLETLPTVNAKFLLVLLRIIFTIKHIQFFLFQCTLL